MITTRSFAVMLLASSIPIAFGQATKIWVNQVAEYSELASCAVGPISTIVRGMSAGCGDGGAITSYSCFCSESSAHFNAVIATSVSQKCSGTMSDVVSALEVFQSYCALGATMTTSSTSSSSTSSSATSTTTSATVASTPSITSAPTTGTTSVTVAAATSSAATLPVSPEMSPGAKAGIAIGVIAIVVAIAGLVTFIVFQRRRHGTGGQGASHLPGTMHLPSSTTVNDFQSRPTTAQPPPVPFMQKDWYASKGGQLDNGSPAPSYMAAEKSAPMAGETLIDMRELPSLPNDNAIAHELPVQRHSRHEMGS